MDIKCINISEELYDKLQYEIHERRNAMGYMKDIVRHWKKDSRIHSPEQALLMIEEFLDRKEDEIYREIYKKVQK